MVKTEIILGISCDMPECGNFIGFITTTKEFLDAVETFSLKHYCSLHSEELINKLIK